MKWQKGEDHWGHSLNFAHHTTSLRNLFRSLQMSASPFLCTSQHVVRMNSLHWSYYDLVSLHRK